MYKKAAELKLRFSTSLGLLSVEQVMDLNMTQLRKEVKIAYSAKKKLEGVDDDAELAFLNEDATSNKELELANLRYEILKDIYSTKKSAIESRIEKDNKATEIKRLEEILAEKKSEAEKSLSVEELEAKIKSLKEANK